MLQSVVEGIYFFLAQIFILPKKMLKMVEAKCRLFLWSSTQLDSRKALIAWEKVCAPQVFWWVRSQKYICVEQTSSSISVVGFNNEKR